ncbi:MAG: galactokinase [Propionibacteriaceae bacterium]|jgi:galactokinase|nr:galactokinase [Propionibacteriaceae bacterium]
MTTPDPITAAVAAFSEKFGGEPEGVWAAPGRVNLIGEHTDYNAGLVLPIALPQRTYAAVRRREDTTLRAVSVGMAGSGSIALEAIAPGNPTNWVRYPAGVLWALQQGGYQLGGLDVAFASEVPVGAGLSSSAAIEGAIGAAASDLFGLDLLVDDAARAQLARYCQQGENLIAGAPTGGMDQAASLRCRDRHALYLDCADGRVEQIPFDLNQSGLALLVIDTRAAHAHASGEYGDRRRDCEQACERLGIDHLRAIDDLATALARLDSDRLRARVRHIVTEIRRVELAVTAIRAKDWTELGRLFLDSHASLRDDFQVSCPELDVAVLASLEAGALGARMTGGGFGGSAIALVYEPSLAATMETVEQQFAARGYNPPKFIVAQAAGWANRII